MSPKWIDPNLHIMEFADVNGKGDGRVGPVGASRISIGVRGDSNVDGQAGVVGEHTAAGIGVKGHSKGNDGVQGNCDSHEHSGVAGINTAGGPGIYGYSANGGPSGYFDGNITVTGKITSEGKSNGNAIAAASSDSVATISVVNNKGLGLWAEAKLNGNAIAAVSNDSVATISAVNNNGLGLWAESKGASRLAAHFEGHVEVTGDLSLTNADCAEDFDIMNAHLIEPGTVMVVGEGGILEPSQFAYDKRVAGVISGAGDYRPGIVLDKQGLQPNRKPIALLGKAFCKVDAQHGAVEIGDLLTTSPTPGHAMKVADHLKAFGAVIGKALRPLPEGQGLVPILIALQ